MKRMGSAVAWAMSRRSNGSRCSGGRSATCAQCWPEIGSDRKPVGSSAERTWRGSALSLPSEALMAISQIDAALTKTSASSMI